MYFFPLPFSPLTPPPPSNHHTVVHVHESFFLFAQSLHPHSPPPAATNILSSASGHGPFWSCRAQTRASSECQKLKQLGERAEVCSSRRITTCPPHLTSSESFPIGLFPINRVIYRPSLSKVIFTHFAKTHKIYNDKVMAEK